MRKFNARACMRQRIWKAMRILRTFSVPALCRVVEGCTFSNVQSFVSILHLQGYVGKVGTVRRGYAGEYQGYQLIKDTGPTMPVFLKGRHKKETNTGEETEKETNEVVENQAVIDLGEVTPAETGGLP